MARPQKSEFKPSNPGKYVGKYPIVTRSGWEISTCTLFDKHPSVLHWSYESISIPYQNPLTRKWTFYIPDFFVVYIDKSNKQHGEMIEVKPLKEVPGYAGKVTPQTRLVQIINLAKWAAATAYCAQRGIKFRIITENQLYGMKLK